MSWFNGWNDYNDNMSKFDGKSHNITSENDTATKHIQTQTVHDQNIHDSYYKAKSGNNYLLYAVIIGGILYMKYK